LGGRIPRGGKKNRRGNLVAEGIKKNTGVKKTRQNLGKKKDAVVCKRKDKGKGENQSGIYGRGTNNASGGQGRSREREKMETTGRNQFFKLGGNKGGFFPTTWMVAGAQKAGQVRKR